MKRFVFFAMLLTFAAACERNLLPDKTVKRKISAA